jgi:photolyase PhrII
MPDETVLSLISQLPSHLRERTRVLPRRQRSIPSNQDGSAVRSEGPVLYWTHHAQRVDENPALDTAIHLACAMGKPLLVTQGLSQHYRYASDRHHVFQLQSARDLSRAYRERRIRFALHVETIEDETRSLLQLARNASIVVTDDFPGEPTDRWVQRLCYLPHLTCIAVDTACVVPMRLVGRAFDRAFAFRDAIQPLVAERIDQPWPVVEHTPTPYEGELPFQPTDIESVELDDLVSHCRIDHGIAPVADTCGGSIAGYRRWADFVAGPIRQYASKRNDPLSGVASRMSAYLHYGMVSPMRLAREASAIRADKYLDELLIWRELAYGFCFYRPEFATVRALPAWAAKTLAEHETDARPILHSWETLSRAGTGDRLWDACQESLIRHGELHNNVRMTWGKALLRWTRNAEQALDLLIDLNHRYALDGRDPASYGGILWCLGQFDRPFSPEQKILGTVRDRSTREHAQRMRLEAYETHVRRPISRMTPRIAIVGAGIAGGMCARTLADHGLDVTLIEKSRGPGGRCATRRIWDKVLVDHGAPYVEFRDARWKRCADSWQQDDVIVPWSANLVYRHRPTEPWRPMPGNRWVGAGGMNAIGKHLGRDLSCLTQRRVISIEAADHRYRLKFETPEGSSDTMGSNLEHFDAVIFAIPAEQIPSMVDMDCRWRGSIPRRVHSPCWTLILLLDDYWSAPFDGARCTGEAVAWLGRESSKPGRTPDPDTWVIQMDASWSENHIDSDPKEVTERILDELEQMGLPAMPGIAHHEIHRWRYAQTMDGKPNSAIPTGPGCYWDESLRLGACGDWLGGTGVEGAMTSGRAMAGRVMQWIVRQGPFDPITSQRNATKSYIQRELF